MKKNNNAAWGMLVTLLGGILWGFSGTCGQYIFQQEAASSQWVTCVRMLGAGVVLIALGLAKQGRSYAGVWRDKKDAAGLLLFAVLGLMFSQYTYMTAISYSNSGTTTALQCTGQVLVLIYSCILVRRWPTRLESVGVVLAVGGTFLLATHGKLGNLAISPPALAWGMASALSLALYTLLPVRLIKKYGSTVVTGWGMLIVGPAGAPDPVGSADAGGGGAAGHGRRIQPLSGGRCLPWRRKGQHDRLRGAGGGHGDFGRVASYPLYALRCAGRGRHSQHGAAYCPGERKKAEAIIGLDEQRPAAGMLLRIPAAGLL